MGKPVAWVAYEDAQCFGGDQGESAFLLQKHKEWNVPLYAPKEALK
jgi:hypothetical protein